MIKTFKGHDRFFQVSILNENTIRLRVSNKDDFPENGPVRYGIYNIACENTMTEYSFKGGIHAFETSSAVFEVNENDTTFCLTDKNGNIYIKSQSPIHITDKGYSLKMFSLSKGRF